MMNPSETIEPAPTVKLKAPVFTVLSWLLPSVAWEIAQSLARRAERPEYRTGYFDGVAEILIGLLIVGVLAYGCGIAAIRRKERCSWLALLPLAIGTLILLRWLWELSGFLASSIR
jgi:hypothetical protein